MDASENPHRLFLQIHTAVPPTSVPNDAAPVSDEGELLDPPQSPTLFWSLLLTEPASSEIITSLAHHYSVTTSPNLVHDPITGETVDTNPDQIWRARLGTQVVPTESPSYIARFRVTSVAVADMDWFNSLVGGVPVPPTDPMFSRRVWVLQVLDHLRDHGFGDIPPIDEAFEASVRLHAEIGRIIRVGLGESISDPNDIYEVDFRLPDPLRPHSTPLPTFTPILSPESFSSVLLPE